MPDAPVLDDAVPLGRVFLLLNNPRHEPVETEDEAIAYLCSNENVLALARDVARNGLNPLERFALFPVNAKVRAGPKATYYVAEGNRRLCALKLLKDPQRAPAKLRASFEKLAETAEDITTVPGAIFDALDDARIWLDRLHNGAQGGIGRREWNAEQKSRFSGGNKNKVAQALLDYAEAEKMLTAEERKGKLTTTQRFVSNDAFQEALGLDSSNPGELLRNRPKAEFDIIVRRFVRDLVEGKKVHSRMNRPHIREYSRPLTSSPGVSATRIEPEVVRAEPARKEKTDPKHKPKRPEKPRHIRYEPEIASGLNGLGNHKLESLYHSICTLELDTHTPLLSVGAWSFFETLTACAGRNESTNFPSFMSKAKVAAYGLGSDWPALSSAITRISHYGNTTKHHSTSATFNGEQLNNDMITLKALTIKCIAEAAAKGS